MQTSNSNYTALLDPRHFREKESETKRRSRCFHDDVWRTAAVSSQLTGMTDDLAISQSQQAPLDLYNARVSILLEKMSLKKEKTVVKRQSSTTIHQVASGKSHYTYYL